MATHAHTVAPGYVEIETGFQGDNIGSIRTWAAPTVVKVGVSSHLQLNIAFPLYFSSDARTNSGLGDITLGVKWRVLDDDALLGDFAVLPAIKFPTASKNLGSGDPDAGVTLISSREVSGVAIDLNATYARNSVGTSNSYGSALWTASFGIPVQGRLAWVAEVFGMPGLDGSRPSTGFLTGPTFLVVPELGVDAGIIVPVYGPQLSAIYAGFVWNVGKLGGSGSSARAAALARSSSSRSVQR